MTDITLKLAASAGLVVGLLILRGFVVRVLRRQLADVDEDLHTWFRARRVTSYIFTFLAVITLTWIWVDAFNALPTYLGLLSAGLAVALADVLKDMAGWLYIVAKKPLKVGQRIEIKGVRGDVVDTRLFRFTLMEIGNWVHADQSTGRLVHIPNAVVFTDALANYTEGSDFIWHEIPVLVTFESDWQAAKAIILDEIQAIAATTAQEAASSLRAMAHEYQVKLGTLTPIVYLTVRDSGVLLTGRYLVSARQSRASEERVWEAILTRFSEDSSLSLAYPTVRTYLGGPIFLNQPSQDEQ